MYIYRTSHAPSLDISNSCKSHYGLVLILIRLDAT